MVNISHFYLNFLSLNIFGIMYIFMLNIFLYLVLLDTILLVLDFLEQLSSMAHGIYQALDTHNTY